MSKTDCININFKDLFKKDIKDANKSYDKRFHEGECAHQLVKERSQFMDLILTRVWNLYSWQSNISLLAVGGYGRGELHPHSDIDLLLLTTEDSIDKDNKNIEEFLENPNFTLIEGDIRSLEDCLKSTKDIDYVLHHAALGSVPRSIKNPITSNDVNVSGFLNMLVASRDNGVKRFVFAASSSTYGDSESLPKIEDVIGKPLSPYAVTKYMNELYADVFSKTYGLETIGLRYFNVFGRRQNPNGAYAAVIPKWIDAILQGKTVYINGDGTTSRDFCYVDNAVQMNLLAATVENEEATNQVYNCAVGDRTSLSELYALLLDGLTDDDRPLTGDLIYRDFRAGDVKHSLADISKARNLLGYQATHRITEGLNEAMAWYLDNLINEESV